MEILKKTFLIIKQEQLKIIPDFIKSDFPSGNANIYLVDHNLQWVVEYTVCFYTTAKFNIIKKIFAEKRANFPVDGRITRSYGPA